MGEFIRLVRSRLLLRFVGMDKFLKFPEVMYQDDDYRVFDKVTGKFVGVKWPYAYRERYFVPVLWNIDSDIIGPYYFASEAGGDVLCCLPLIKRKRYWGHEVSPNGDLSLWPNNLDTALGFGWYDLPDGMSRFIEEEGFKKCDGAAYDCVLRIHSIAKEGEEIMFCSEITNVSFTASAVPSSFHYHMNNYIGSTIRTYGVLTEEGGVYISPENLKRLKKYLENK